MSRENKQPFVRFYASDWLAGTRGMKANEVGIYITLIAMMYERCEPLPEDHKRLSRQCGCSPAVFKSVLEMLFDDQKIIRIDDGLWNNRVEKEFKWRQKNSQQSKRAADVRWEKDNKNNGNGMPAQSERNAGGMPNHKPETISHKEPPKPPKGDVGYSKDFEVFWKLYPNRQGGSPKKTTYQRWKQRLRDGFTVEKMTEGARQYAAHIRQTDKEGSPYVKQASTFLNKEDPPHFLANWGGTSAPTQSPETLSFEDWEIYVRAFKEQGEVAWPKMKCGPHMPNDPLCQAPEELLMKYGFRPNPFNEGKTA